MSDNNNSFDPFDPMGVFKSMRDTNMDAWSKTMIQMVNSEAYAKATGTLLDSWLTASAPLQKVLESAINQALANLQLPSRNDVMRLAERLTNIEMRLDDLDARLDEIQRSASKAARPKNKPDHTESKS